jgi:hypothetical protein
MNKRGVLRQRGVSRRKLRMQRNKVSKKKCVEMIGAASKFDSHRFNVIIAFKADSNERIESGKFRESGFNRILALSAYRNMTRGVTRLTRSQFDSEGFERKTAVSSLSLLAKSFDIRDVAVRA